MDLRDLYKENNFVIDDVKSGLPGGFKPIFSDLVRRYHSLNPNFPKTNIITDFVLGNRKHPMSNISDVKSQLELGAFAGYLAFKNNCDLVEISSGLGIPTISASINYGVNSYVVEPEGSFIAGMYDFLNKFSEITNIKGKVKNFTSLDELSFFEKGFLGFGRKIKNPVVIANKPHAKLLDLIYYVKEHDASLVYYPCNCADDFGADPKESVNNMRLMLNDDRFNTYLLDKPMGYVRIWK